MKINQKKIVQKGQDPHQNWTAFTYVGRQTKYITKIFKRTNLKIAYKTKIAIKKLLRPKPRNQDKYINSGIYQLQCQDCSKKCTGQTGRSFYQRYKECFRDFKTDNNKSNFEKRLIEYNHSVNSIEK